MKKSIFCFLISGLSLYMWAADMPKNNKDLQITIEEQALAYYYQPIEIAYQAAYQKALEKARLFCPNGVILPPSNILKWRPRIGGSGSFGQISVSYKATFHCKSDINNPLSSTPSKL